MKMMKYSILLLFSSILLVGCINIPLGDGNKLKVSKDGITITDNEGDEHTISVDEDKGEVNIDGFGADEDGVNYKHGDNLDPPENFPSDIPLTDDANIMQTNSSSTAIYVGYVTKKSPDEINDLYLPYLEGDKFTEGPSTFENEEDDDTYKVIQSVNETESVSVQFTDSNEIENGTNVIIIVAIADEDE